MTDPAPPGSTPTGAQVRLHRMDGFRRPTVEEVAAFVAKHGLRCEPGAFIDHFTSNGWKVGGRAPMKDWQAAVRNWDRKAREGPAGAKAQRDEDDALLRRRQILTG